jgi:hypothetical protein
MDELCVHRTMSLLEWIELASTLDVDGIESVCFFRDKIDSHSGTQVNSI